jgi:hypothetical protein
MSHGRRLAMTLEGLSDLEFSFLVLFSIGAAYLVVAVVKLIKEHGTADRQRK